MEKDKRSVSGVLKEIRFHQNNYLIGRLDNRIAVKGNMISPQIGLEYEFQGKWKHYPQWGDTFLFDEYKASYPKDLAAIRSYLMENCKWIGPEISKKLVNIFGEDTLSMCKTNPETIAGQIPGITKPRALEISVMLRHNEADEELQLELKKLLVGTKISKRAVSRAIELYGRHAPEKIRENPYQLIEDIEGVGFLTADEIAVKAGFDKEGRPRIQTGIVHIFKEAAFSFGHTCLPQEALINKCRSLLQLPKEMIFHVIDQMLEEKCLVKFGDFICLDSYYQAEKKIAHKLKLLLHETDEIKDSS